VAIGEDGEERREVDRAREAVAVFEDREVLPARGLLDDEVRDLEAKSR
jgi:hypothetical protein